MEGPEALEQEDMIGQAHRFSVRDGSSIPDENPPYDFGGAVCEWRHTAGGDMTRRTRTSAPGDAGGEACRNSPDRYSVSTAGLNRAEGAGVEAAFRRSPDGDSMFTAALNQTDRANRVLGLELEAAPGDCRD